MKRNHRAMLVVAILCIGLPILDAVAGKMSGGYSKPSSVSISRPSAANLYSKPVSLPKTSSAGYSKPPSAIKSADQAPPISSGGYQKPSIANSAPNRPPSQTAATDQPVRTAFTKGNRFDQNASLTLQRQKASASLEAYNQEKEKFKAPPVIPGNAEERQKTFSSNPVFKSAKRYGDIGYDDVLARRRARFGSWNPPVIIYQSAPSYGSWNSTFLYWALWNDSSFGYHHYNDPAYIAWHNDAMQLAQQNGELKAKLDALDQRTAELQQANAPRNANYLPSQVAQDPLVALSSEAIDSMPIQKPTLRVATGVQGGRYAQVGNLLKQKAGRRFDIELIPTSGSAENLALIRGGKADAGIIQSDTDFVEQKILGSKSENDPVIHRAPLYSEYVMLVVGKDSPIKSVKDLGKDNTVYVGPEGSGTATTWNGLVMQDGQYESVKVQNIDYDSALERIRGDKTKVMLFVAGQQAPLLVKAAASGLYRLVPVDDKDLSKVVNAEGHEVYDSLVIPAGMYPGMQNGELKTLAVDAIWAISEEWVKRFGDPAFDNVNYAVIETISDLHMHAENSTAPGASSTATAAKSQSHWFRNIVIICIIIFGCWWIVTKWNF